MPNKLIVALFLIMNAGEISAQEPQPLSTQQTVTFHFLSGQDMFFSDLNDNTSELKRLYHFIDEYHADIMSGLMHIYVDGYCASQATRSKNLNIAYIRANRVKSELITRNGLREKNFVTKNHSSDYKNQKDMVVVTIYISAPKEESTNTNPEREPEPLMEEQQIDTSATDISRMEESGISSVSGQQEIIITQKHAPRYVAVKTNLAAWAGTILNVAADIQVSRQVSLELPVLWCPWHIGDRRSVSIFAIQPEARWWLSQPGMGHFFGVHASIAWFNVRWKDDRYQNAGRPLLGTGLSYGYFLPLGSRWAGEFTLGAGYANMRYDTYYNIDNGARIDTRTKNYWGITRIGVSVAYRFTTK